MATYRVQAPDGSILKIEGPENASEADILAFAQQQFKPARQTTGLGAFAAGTAQGLSAGFYDEGAAGLGALYDYATGQGGLSESYDRRVKEQRDYIDAAARENPGWYYTGEIGSAVALPFTAPGRLAARGAQAVAQRVVGAPGLRNRMLAGAVEGAGYGAAYGAGKSEGDLQARAEGAVGGAVIGGGVGAAAVPIMAGAAAAGQGIANRVRSVVAPEREAARRVALAVDQDIAKQPLTPAARQLVNDGVAGQELRRIDMGENTRALARSAANVSPDAREVLSEAIDPRFEGQGQRVLDFLRSRVASPGNVDASREALRLRANATNRVNYVRAFDAGDRPLFSPELERLTGSPIVRQAMQRASESGKNRAIAEGYRAFNTRVDVTPDGQVVFRGGREGVPAYPNLQFWDAVKRELDDLAGAAQRSGEKGAGNTAATLARQLREELDTMVPAYKATRTQAMRYFQANDAIEAGEKFAAGGTAFSANKAERIVQKMKPEERAAFREGYLSRLIDDIQRTPDRRTIANKIANSPDARRRMELALGQKTAREVEAFMHIETVMDRARGAVQGNSTTARQLMELGLAGGAGAAVSGGNMFDPTFWATAMATYAGKRGVSAQNQRMARRIGQLLTRSADPQALQRAMSRISASPSMMNVLRDMVSKAAPAAGGLAAGQQAAQEAPAN